ncbi:uncharacterized protein ISCGN_031789 [Ixodes scapularis]
MPGVKPQPQTLVTNFRQESQHLTKGTAVGYVEEIQDSAAIAVISEDASPTQNKTITSSELDIDPSLPAPQRRQLRDLLAEFSECFSASSKVRQTTVAKHRIITDDDALPVHRPPYRVSVKEKEAIQQQDQEMLDDDIVQPSGSPWASPVVLVKKKDGTLIFYVDYRRLNAGANETTTSFVEDVLRLVTRADPQATDEKKLRILMRGVRDDIFGGLVRNPPTTVETFVTEATNIERALQARAAHFHRAPAVAAPTPSSCTLSPNIPGIREIVRDIVREELKKLRVESLLTEMRRQGSTTERQAAAIERQAAAMERQAVAMERQAAAMRQQAAAMQVPRALLLLVAMFATALQPVMPGRPPTPPQLD